MGLLCMAVPLASTAVQSEVVLTQASIEANAEGSGLASHSETAVTMQKDGARMAEGQQRETVVATVEAGGSMKRRKCSSWLERIRKKVHPAHRGAMIMRDPMCARNRLEDITEPQPFPLLPHQTEEERRWVQQKGGQFRRHRIGQAGSRGTRQTDSGTGR